MSPPPPDSPGIQPGQVTAILTTLERHQVHFVLIGGMAARSRGWNGRTQDVDITPRADDDNYQRLAAALTELDARFRVEGYPTGFAPPGGLDARTFRGQVSLAFRTREGDLDVAIVPDGTRGYPDLRMSATREQVRDTNVTVLVCSAKDIVRSKTQAGRAKDELQLPSLMRDMGLEPGALDNGLDL
jgi:hypothetical protein